MHMISAAMMAEQALKCNGTRSEADGERQGYSRAGHGRPEDFEKATGNFEFAQQYAAENASIRETLAASQENRPRYPGILGYRGRFLC